MQQKRANAHAFTLFKELYCWFCRPSLKQKISDLENILRKKNRLIALREDELREIGKQITEKEKEKEVKLQAPKNITIQPQQESIDI